MLSQYFQPPVWASGLLLVSSVLAVCLALWVNRKQKTLASQMGPLENQYEDLKSAFALEEQKRQQLEDKDKQTEVELRQLREQHTIFRVRADEKTQRLMEQQQTVEQQDRELKALYTQVRELQSELVRTANQLENERQFHQEKLTGIEQSRQQLKQEFEVLANRLFETSTQKLSQHSEGQLKQVLSPIQEQMKTFQRKVEDVYDKESQQRFSLTSEIKKLQSLNERMSEDAVALTNALKGENKMAGNWGEMVLERLLELSGLRQGRDYAKQEGYVNRDGKRLLPDVVVNLPDEKTVIIDSKVSLVAYEKMYNAESEEQLSLAVKQHITSIRQHVRGLSQKKYQELPGLHSLNFVLLFVPIEGAFTALIENDSQIIGEAYNQNVLLTSPTTLLATLRVISNLWRQEDQSRNAAEIARQAGNLYDKFANFCQDMLEIGQRVNQTQTAYEQAIGRLSEGRGNLLSRIDKLKELGANTTKNIPASLVEQSDLSQVE